MLRNVCTDTGAGMSIVMLMCAIQQEDCARHGAALQLQHHTWTETSSVADKVVTTGVAIGLQLGHSGVITHGQQCRYMPPLR